MSKRYHCEFNNCYCRQYILHCSNKCFECNHANIWHSSKSKPPSDSYLSFVSPRLSAHVPSYTHNSPIQIAVFVPEVPSIPDDSDNVIIYCKTLELLPI